MAVTNFDSIKGCVLPGAVKAVVVVNTLFIQRFEQPWRAGRSERQGNVFPGQK